jgi:hypothetical protein
MPAFAITRKIGNSMNSLPFQISDSSDDLDISGKTLVYKIFAKRDGADVTLTFSTGATIDATTGQLTVTDAAQRLYTLSIGKAGFTLDKGTFLGALRITDPSDSTYELELPDDAAGDQWTFIDELVSA